MGFWHHFFGGGFWIESANLPLGLKSRKAYGSVKGPELVKKVNEEIQNLLQLDRSFGAVNVCDVDTYITHLLRSLEWFQVS